MSNSKLIPRERWTKYFDAFSKRYLRDERSEVATIMLASPFVGTRTAVDGARVIGITYDKHNDVLDVALEGVDHLVHHPRTIRVTEDGGGFIRKLVVDRRSGPREVIMIGQDEAPVPAVLPRALFAPISARAMSVTAFASYGGYRIVEPPRRIGEKARAAWHLPRRPSLSRLGRHDAASAALCAEP